MIPEKQRQQYFLMQQCIFTFKGQIVTYFLKKHTQAVGSKGHETISENVVFSTIKSVLFSELKLLLGGRQQLLPSLKRDNTWARLMSINLSLFHCHSSELRLQIMRKTNEPKTKDCTENLKTNDASCSLFEKFFLFLWLRKKDSAQH